MIKKKTIPREENTRIGGIIVRERDIIKTAINTITDDIDQETTIMIKDGIITIRMIKDVQTIIGGMKGINAEIDIITTTTIGTLMMGTIIKGVIDMIDMMVALM